MYLYTDSLPGLGKAQPFYGPYKLITIVAALLMVCSFHSFTQAQSLNKQWDKRFGGNKSDLLSISIQTSEGGFLLGGHSYSGKGGDKTQLSRGDMDYWIVKVDSLGNKLWDKTFGGNKEDRIYSLIETKDGGYLLPGYTYSDKGGDITEENKGTTAYPTSDYWIIKVDNEGNKLWDKRFGGNDWDQLYSAFETSDGGYLLAGWSNSYWGGDLTDEPQGLTDYWIVKIDSLSNKLWDKRFGSYNNDYFDSAIQTSDQGYLLAGWSDSNVGGDKTEELRGEVDYWIIKIDSIGNKLWDKTLGGNKYDYPESVIQTSDGGFLLAGESTSDLSGDKSQANKGEWDYWIIKTDATGTKLWDKTFGGNYHEWFASGIQGTDGGYLLAGWTQSDKGADITEANKGIQNSADYWIVSIDANGNKQWDKRLGGNLDDILTCAIQAKAGDYLLAGFSYSAKGGDKTQDSQGDIDYWILKITPHKVLPSAFRVNFQDRYSKPPVGWLKDYGLAFGNKAYTDTTYTFGWKQSSDGETVDLSVGGHFPGNGRRRPAPSDVLLATLMHMQGDDVENFRGTPVDAYWELAVENGDYQVTVLVGDGTNYTGTDLESHSINVEGIPAITHFIPQGGNGASTRFKQSTLKVVVTDGLLTIDANGGTNTKLNYAIIQPLEVNSPVASRRASPQLQPTAPPHVSVYPNPFADKLTFTLSSGQQGKLHLTVTDALGKVLYKETKQIQDREMELNLSTVALKAGMYVIRLRAENGFTQVIRAVKY